MTFDGLLQVLDRWVRARGIAVITKRLDVETPAEFDGLSITINAAHDAEARTYYLVHSFGSIAAWSADRPGVAAMFEELRAAKRTRTTDPDRLERALVPFRAFEERASEHSVWVLDQIHHGWAIPTLSVFFRADLEAITAFHRTGRAPVWPDFLAQWKAEIATGRRPATPFAPRPVPPFRPVRIETQEVEQERDGK
jgi:hypothetical protein